MTIPTCSIVNFTSISFSQGQVFRASASSFNLNQSRITILETGWNPAAAASSSSKSSMFGFIKIACKLERAHLHLDLLS